MRIAQSLRILMTLLVPSLSSASVPIRLAPNSGFVPNQGQAPAEVLYVGSVPGGAVYLTRDAIILDTWTAERSASEEDVRHIGRAVWVRFAASNPNAVLESESRSKSRGCRVPPVDS